MLSINSPLANDLEKIQQLERRKRLQDNREKTARIKNNERRAFIVGKIFLEVFPEFKHLQPQKTAADNEREFSSLKNFLFKIASEKNDLNP